MPGRPAARLTDMHNCPATTGIVPHVGGPIVAPGCPTVLIGDAPVGSPVALAGAAGMAQALNAKQDAEFKEEQRRKAENLARAKRGEPPLPDPKA